MSVVGRLLLVRTAESEGNRERRFTLHPGIPLDRRRARRRSRPRREWIAAHYAPRAHRHEPASPARGRRPTSSPPAWACRCRVEPDLRERRLRDARRRSPTRHRARDTIPPPTGGGGRRAERSLVEVGDASRGGARPDRRGRRVDEVARGESWGRDARPVASRHGHLGRAPGGSERRNDRGGAPGRRLSRRPAASGPTASGGTLGDR